MQLRIERMASDAPPEERREALRLVLRLLPDETAEHLATGVAFAAADDPRHGELWRAADEQGRLVGAVWAQVQAGGTAVVWPPQWQHVVVPWPDPLLEALLHALQRRGTVLAQSLLPDGEVPEAGVLRAAGFERLAELTYLAAKTETPAAPPAADPQFVPFREADRRPLAALIERTYEGTLDCPALNGLRRTDDVLAEYETIGSGGTRLWSIVRSGGQEVGCLLLADHAEQDQLEVVYMGLVPEARGRGLGTEIAHEALRAAAGCGRSQVVLAVDAANAPALEMYRRAGFMPWLTRTAMVKVLRRD